MLWRRNKSFAPLHKMTHKEINKGRLSEFLQQHSVNFSICHKTVMSACYYIKAMELSSVDCCPHLPQAIMLPPPVTFGLIDMSHWWLEGNTTVCRTSFQDFRMVE
jgi:hypothetical protein